MIVFNKTYRIVAESSTVFTDPMEPQTGKTAFDETLYPLHFETDDAEAMREFIDIHNIALVDSEQPQP